MIKQILPTLKILALAMVLSFGISYALAWTAPTATPPTGNVSAPINTGSTKQVKLGDLCTSFSGTEKCLSSAQLAVPSTTFSASPTIIQSGQTTTLTWSVTDATSCTASGSWAGAKATSGSEVSSALSGTGGPISYTFTLSCTGAGGTTSKDVTVQVLAPYTATYTGGSGTWVSIPSSVTVVKFKAQGGSGMWGGSSTPCGGAGGSASFAYYGAKVPIVVVGGGGGAACIVTAGAGGYTGANVNGAGGNGYYGTAGAIGNSTAGGAGGQATAPPAAGGAGGANTTRSNGSDGTAYPGDGSYSPSYCSSLSGGLGGSGLTNNGIGGTNGNSYYAGGGGGGLGGGGGGGCGNLGGGGGGGSGYLVAGATGPDVNGYVTVPLSAIGNPASVYIFGGAGGGAAAAGYITMTW